MINYEEIERALKELLPNVQTIPGTFPPVYAYNDFLIGYNRQGQIKIIGSAKNEPPLQPDSNLENRHKRLRFHLAVREIRLKLSNGWFKHWSQRRQEVIKAASAH